MVVETGELSGGGGWVADSGGQRVELRLISFG